MKKKVIGPILCFIFIIAVVFGTLYVIDHNRMDNNEPVLFSTWGKKYAPPLESYSAVMCSAQSFDGEHLDVTFDDEKHTTKRIAVKDKALVQKLSEISLARIIGVNIEANIPDSVLEELSDYYRVHTTQLLIDYDDFDKYFEVVDVSLSDADYSANNMNSFVGKIIEETTTYMIVEPEKDEYERTVAEQIKIEYGTDHRDYLYGPGRLVVIYYKGGINTNDGKMSSIKTDDISTEGFREWEMKVVPSNESSKKKIIEKTQPHDSDTTSHWYKQYNLYYYGLEDVIITVDGEQHSLAHALKRGKITMSAILAKANRDVSDGIISDLRYEDGGSVVFKYPDYTIVKYHTLDGNDDMYIGTPDIDIDVKDK